MSKPARESERTEWVNGPEARAAIEAARQRIVREATFDDGRLLQGIREGERIATGILAVGIVRDIFKALGKLPDDA